MVSNVYKSCILFKRESIGIWLFIKNLVSFVKNNYFSILSAKVYTLSKDAIDFNSYNRILVF